MTLFTLTLLTRGSYVVTSDWRPCRNPLSFSVPFPRPPTRLRDQPNVGHGGGFVDPLDHVDHGQPGDCHAGQCLHLDASTVGSTYGDAYGDAFVGDREVDRHCVYSDHVGERQ